MTRLDELIKVEKNFSITKAERNHILTCKDENLERVIKSVRRSAYHRGEGENI